MRVFGSDACNVGNLACIDVCSMSGNLLQNVGTSNNTLTCDVPEIAVCHASCCTSCDAESDIFFLPPLLSQEQGHLVTNHTNHNSTSAAALRRVWNFQVHGTSPRLQHPCGVLDFEISMGRLTFHSFWTLGPAAGLPDRPGNR